MLAIARRKRMERNYNSGNYFLHRVSCSNSCGPSGPLSVSPQERGWVMALEPMDDDLEEHAEKGRKIREASMDDAHTKERKDRVRAFAARHGVKAKPGHTKMTAGELAGLRLKGAGNLSIRDVGRLLSHIAAQADELAILNARDYDVEAAVQKVVLAYEESVDALKKRVAELEAELSDVLNELREFEISDV